MKRDCIEVKYSFEHGDSSLPHIKDLVSTTEDPEKSRILTYLRTQCICVCPGIVKDEISTDKTIGCGDVYSDGTYVWDDVFTNYVDQYNIPVPLEFREHILKNFDDRIKSHALLRNVDRVIINNNPYLGYSFDVRINKSGSVFYNNNSDCVGGQLIYLDPNDSKYIIDPIMSELFCYDADNHGSAIIDGYSWNIQFYIKDNLIKTISGHEGEDTWRFEEIKRILEFVERYINKDLGVSYLEKRKKIK